MQTGKDIFTDGLFTKSRLGPEALTHKAIEDYLSKGRHMRSVYAVDLFTRQWRLLGAVLWRGAAWLFTLDKKMGAASAEEFRGFFQGEAGEIDSRRAHGRWDKPHPCRPCG